MGRPSLTREVLNALFARSGNQCAYPGCTHELVTARNQFVGQICHIEAANPGGPRFNPLSTDEERRSALNLLVMCYQHHKETDDTVRFPPETLRDFKRQHETRYAENPFKVNESFLHRLQHDIDDYWTRIEATSREAQARNFMSVSIPAAAASDDAFDNIGQAIERVQDLLKSFSQSDESVNGVVRTHLLALGYDLTAYDAVPYYNNPLVNRNWEMHALAAHNVITDLQVLVQELEVRFYEEYVKTRPADASALAALDKSQRALMQKAASTGYAD